MKNTFPSKYAPNRIALSGEAKECRLADILPVQKVKLPFIMSKHIKNDTKPDGKRIILYCGGPCQLAICYFFF